MNSSGTVARGGGPKPGRPDGLGRTGVTEREGIVAAEQDAARAGSLGQEPDGLRAERDGVEEQVAEVVRRPLARYPVTRQRVRPVPAVQSHRLIGQEPA